MDLARALDLSKHATCGCCGFHAQEDILDALAARGVYRAAGVVRNEPGDPPFTGAEEDLTGALAENADEAAAQVEGPLQDALAGEGFDEDVVLQRASEAASAWERVSWGAGVAGVTSEIITGATQTGVAQAAVSNALSDLDMFRIVNGMSQSAKYYTNQYFNTQVMPALVDAVQDAVLRGERATGAAAIREVLDRRLRSVPYWRLVANAAASRSYHYGLVMMGAQGSAREVVYRAVIDTRTSEICQAMNGTRWPISDMVDLVQRIADADPEQIRVVTPWMRIDDIRDLSPSQLYALGVAVPPLHGNCRSELVLA